MNKYHGNAVFCRFAFLKYRFFASTKQVITIIVQVMSIVCDKFIMHHTFYKPFLYDVMRLVEQQECPSADKFFSRGTAHLRPRMMTKTNKTK